MLGKNESGIMDFVPYAEAVAPGARPPLLLRATGIPDDTHLRLAQKTVSGAENVQQYDDVTEGAEIEFDVDPRGGPVRAFTFLSDSVNDKNRRVPAPTHARLRPLASAILGESGALRDQWNHEEASGELRVVAGEVPIREDGDYASMVSGAYEKYRAETRGLTNFSTPIAEGIFLPAYRLPGGVVAPAWGFYALGMDRGPMPVSFLRGLLEAASFLHNVDLETEVLTPLRSFLRRAPSTTDKGFTYAELRAVEVVCDALCLPATMTDYVGDRSQRGKSIERMFYAVWAGAGDCEDDFKQIQLTDLGVQRIGAAGSLQPVIDFVRLYTAVGVTGMATTPSLQKSSRETKNQRDYICHVWAMLVPTTTLLALEDGYAVEPETALQHLGNLVLEGTNYTTALQRAPIEIYASRADAERVVAQRDATTEALRSLPEALRELPVFIPARPRLTVPKTPAEQSRFYRFGISLWTPRGEFRIVHADTGAIAVTFQQLLGIEGEWTLARTGASEAELAGVRAAVDALDVPVLSEPSAPPELTPDNAIYRRLAEKSEPVGPESVVLRLNHINELTEEVEEALEGRRFELRYFPFFAGNVGIVGLRVAV